MEPSSLNVSKEKQATLFERGFKTWCQNISTSIRRRLGQPLTSPLSPYVLAEKLNVIVWNLGDIPELSKEAFNHLTSDAGNEWSAVTVFANNKTIIVINPTHSKARQSSDLMHELAHVLRKHEAGQIFISDSGYAIRNFDEKQEAEADWLAGTLLLPKEVLMHCHFKKYSVQDSCSIYGVSESLFRYRMNMSYVKQIYKRY